jgi:hypothetical protein
MSTQYRLVQSRKTASGGCSAGPRFVRACSATDFYYLTQKSLVSIMNQLSSAITGMYFLTKIL